MHISEGVLTAPVLAGGAALAVVGLGVGLRKMDYDRLPKVGLMAAVFFVASLIHIPVGPASVHLVLNGLVGILLGWAAFPAIFVGLTLQAILFQHGGLTSLGVNTASMALPALACYWACSPLVRGGGHFSALAAGFIAGAGAVLGAALMVALALYLSGDAFRGAAQAIIVANLPIMMLEGLISAAAVGFLKKVRPAMLDGGQLR